MKDRDIEKAEINRITELCSIREKAFFTVMRQSGLAPSIIKQLRIENVEKILEKDTPMPCKIAVPRQKLSTFIAGEGISYLKQYLATRNDSLTEKSLLFTARNNPKKEINTKDVSRAFARAAQKAKLNYEIGEFEPSELRLFSLVKFYRKNAKDYERKISRTPFKDDAACRNLYEDRAMPLLEIEPPSKTEIQKLIKKNNELEKELNMISESMTNRLFPILQLFDSIDGLEEFLHKFKAEQDQKRHAITEEGLREELERAGEKRDKMIERFVERLVPPNIEQMTPEERTEYEQTLKEKSLKRESQKNDVSNSLT